jgi:hypothetical protein
VIGGHRDSADKPEQGAHLKVGAHGAAALSLLQQRCPGRFRFRFRFRFRMGDTR